jgi:protein TonB
MLLAPQTVPSRIAQIDDDNLHPPSNAAVSSDLAGAPPDGLARMIGTLGVQPAAPPPLVKEPPKPAVPQRIRVVSNVQQANLIRKIQPAYPTLARQARVQGVVRFTAIIGKDGEIQNLQLVTGHPLLVAAAREALSQWRYKPTLLNGEPVEVVTQIDVNFTLAQ